LNGISSFIFLIGKAALSNLLKFKTIICGMENEETRLECQYNFLAIESLIVMKGNLGEH